MKIQFLVTVIAGSILCGCATTRYPEAAFPKRDADLDILATQRQIESENQMPSVILASGGLAGLLIAGAIYNVDKNLAAEAIAPIRNQLGDYDLSGQFAERIQSTDIAAQLVAGAEPVVWRSPGPPEEREIERTLITIEPRVQLSNDMRTLLVDLEVWEFIPRDGYTPPRKGFSQSYRFLWPLEGGDDLEREEAAAAWVDRPREELIALIEMGMDETVRMLETHLEERTLSFEQPDGIVRIPPSGRFHLWQGHEDTFWLARKSGRGLIYAVPAHAIEEAPKARQIGR